MLPLKNFPYKLVLGSGSPRRKELLAGIGFDFTVVKKDVDETYPPDLPMEQVPEYLSRLKAEAFTEAELPENYLLITADTMVLLDGRPIHKPKNREEAISHLQALSGRVHSVITGVTMRSKEKQKSFSVESKVKFREFDLDEIEYYVDTCQPYDKAGGYGIQEWLGYVGIESVEGSFYNVMGLPTRRLYEELTKYHGLQSV